MDPSFPYTADMDENNNSWPVPDLLDMTATNIEMWLSTPEEHGFLGTPMEASSPSMLDFQIEHAPAAILDFDLSFDDFMKDIQETASVHGPSRPDWLEGLTVSALLKLYKIRRSNSLQWHFGNEVLLGSAETVSSRHSHHRTRHTQSSLPYLKDLQSETDLDLDVADLHKPPTCMWETTSEKLRGFGGHLEFQTADGPLDGRSTAFDLYSQDTLFAELQGSHHFQPANSPICLQGFDSPINEMKLKEMDEDRMIAERISEGIAGTPWPLEVQHVTKLDEGLLSVDEWFERVPMDLHFRISLQSYNLQSTSSATLEECAAPSPLDNYGPTERVYAENFFPELPRLPGPRKPRYVGSAQGSASSCDSSMISAVSGASHASWSGRKGWKKKTSATRSRDLGILPGGFQPFPCQPLPCQPLPCQPLPCQPLPCDAKRPYQCTWCPAKFTKASDWKRHEESQHAPQTEWVCMLHGAEVPRSGRIACVLCGIPEPEEHHLRYAHSQWRCLDGTMDDRRFDRKDHLVQHLKIIHGIMANKSFPLNIETWKRNLYQPDVEPLWKCGFCSEARMPWEQRYLHLSEHIKGRVNVSLWRRCICTREGVPTNIFRTLQRLRPQIYLGTCYLYVWSGIQESSWPKSCGKTISAVLNREMRRLSPSVGLPEEVCVLYWCGFCQQIFKVNKPDAYDCARLSHFCNTHSTSELESSAWLGMSDQTQADFYAAAYDLIFSAPFAKDFCSCEPAVVMAQYFALELLKQQRWFLETPSEAESNTD